MTKNINFSDFCDAFKAFDRDNNFTHEGKRALFDYLERLEEDTDEPIELDVIALCCEYTEYKSAKEAHELHAQEPDEDISEDNALRWLEDNTGVIVFDGGIIMQDF